MLEKYPDANSIVTANYYSDLFNEFEKYHPAGIVQYSVAKTDQLTQNLSVTVIFDRYYGYDNAPLTIVQCTGENYSSLVASGFPIGSLEIEKC